MAPLLELKNITKVYSRGLINRASTTALSNVSLTIDEAEPTIMTVAGESGSGKTTLAMLLLGFIQPSEGQIYYKGKDISTLMGEERITFRREVQAVFQDPFAVFNPFYTVDHLLSVPIERFKLAKSKAQARDKMAEALTAVGLRPDDILGRFPHQLSGGQRQRINVARALLLKPRLLVADEPVSMVDASLRATILGSLRKLNREFGISLLYITHDLTTAYQISQNIIVLYGGSVSEAGDVELVVRQPKHPYTQLLIGSIPSPNPRHRWTARRVGGEIAPTASSNGSCRFAARCPSVMPRCWERHPPLFHADEHRVVACYLHETEALTETDVMDQVFVH